MKCLYCRFPDALIFTARVCMLRHMNNKEEKERNYDK